MIPQLQQRIDYNDIIFVQDGSPSHYGTSVRDLLDTFPGGWLGRRGRIEGPVSSPHLTPMDFFLGGVVRERVYASNPTTVE